MKTAKVSPQMFCRIHAVLLRFVCCYKLLWQHYSYDDDGGGDMYSDVDDIEPVVSIAVTLYSNILGHYRLRMKLVERKLQ